MYNTRRGGLNVNDVPLVVAGSIGLVATAIHGVAGELVVVRKLSPATLPASRFGGPKATRLMIHVTWHITTVAFLAVAVALLLSGAVLDGDAARGIARLAAGAATGFATVAVLLGAASSPRSLLRHKGPLLLTAIAAFAWWGAL
jgi:hypothetical protein